MNDLKRDKLKIINENIKIKDEIKILNEKKNMIIGDNAIENDTKFNEIKTFKEYNRRMKTKVEDLTKEIKELKYINFYTLQTLTHINK